MLCLLRPSEIPLLGLLVTIAQSESSSHFEKFFHKFRIPPTHADWIAILFEATLPLEKTK